MSDRYRLARMAYPKQYRREHYAELVSTADALSGDRWSLRQGGSLLAHGLRTRSRLATGGSAANIWRAAVRVNLFVVIFLIGVTDVARMSETRPSGALVAVSVLALASLGALMLRLPHLTAALITVWAAASLWQSDHVDQLQRSGAWSGDRLFAAAAVTWLALYVVGAWWLTTGHRSKRSGQRGSRSVMVTVTIIAAATMSVTYGLGYDAVAPIHAATLYGLIVWAGVVGWFDPRPAAAAALVLTQVSLLTSGGIAVVSSNVTTVDLLIVIAPACLAAVAGAMTVRGTRLLNRT